MADNTSIPWLNQVYASDNIDDVFYQRVKLTLGTDGVNDGDVSTTNPIPTLDTNSESLLSAILILIEEQKKTNMLLEGLNQ